LFYGYATGVFSARKIEAATWETVPVRSSAGNLPPAHDTIAPFRTTVLPELKDLFVQVLGLAHLAGLLAWGHSSLEGSTIHAAASQRKAVRYKRRGEIEAQLRAQGEALLALSARAEQQEAPAGLVIADEIVLRQAHLTRWAEAKAVLEARAPERAAPEQADYEATVAARAEHARRTGHAPRGRPPRAPTPGPRDTDQDNFTDPEARIMKTPTAQGCEQDDNVQVAGDQVSLLSVGNALSTPPNAPHDAAPTRDAIPPEIGTPAAAALDTGYCGPATREACADRGSEPYIATGREPHHQSGPERFAPRPALVMRLRPLTPGPRYRGPTHSRPRGAKPFMGRANARSSRSSGSSKRSWASGTSRCVDCRPPRGNGAWSAWPAIASGGIPCSRAPRGAWGDRATAAEALLLTLGLPPPPQRRQRA